MMQFKCSTSAKILVGLMVLATAQPAAAEDKNPGFAITSEKPEPVASEKSEPVTSEKSQPVTSEKSEPVTSEKSQPVANGNLMPTDPKVQQLNRLNDRYKCGVDKVQKEISQTDLSRNIATCLTSLETKVAQNPGTVTPEDLAQLKELVASFSSEVGDLDNRVTKLEDTVKKSTFSTTSKLVGEVVVGLTTFNGNTNATNSTNGTVLTNRVRLNVDTSFTGKDRLRTRLQSRNTTPLNGATTTNTRMTRLGFDGDEGNSTNLSLLQYTLPVFDRSKLIVETVGSEFNENMYTFNPLLASSGGGSLTRFGRFNPIYRQSGDGAAATFDYRLSDQLTTSVGYAIPGTVAADPTSNITPAATGGGVTGGANAFIAQVRYEVAPDINLGLNYSRSYSPNGANISGGTGSGRANSPFGANATSANHYNFLASAKLSPGFVLSGWAGLTNANREGAAGNADLYNFAVTAAFPDMGGPGNMLGLIIGVPPKVTGGSIAADPDTSLHLEALYKIKMSDNLDITPGFLVITNPEHNATRNSEFVGTVRTTFRF
jgi:hypothetical protein